MGTLHPRSGRAVPVVRTVNGFNVNDDGGQFVVCVDGFGVGMRPGSPRAAWFVRDVVELVEALGAYSPRVPVPGESTNRWTGDTPAMMGRNVRLVPAPYGPGLLAARGEEMETLLPLLKSGAQLAPALVMPEFDHLPLVWWAHAVKADGSEVAWPAFRGEPSMVGHVLVDEYERRTGRKWYAHERAMNLNAVGDLLLHGVAQVCKLIAVVYPPLAPLFGALGAAASAGAGAMDKNVDEVTRSYGQSVDDIGGKFKPLASALASAEQKAGWVPPATSGSGSSAGPTAPVGGVPSASAGGTGAPSVWQVALVEAHGLSGEWDTWWRYVYHVGFNAALGVYGRAAMDSAAALFPALAACCPRNGS